MLDKTVPHFLDVKMCNCFYESQIGKGEENKYKQIAWDNFQRAWSQQGRDPRHRHPAHPGW